MITTLLAVSALTLGGGAPRLIRVVSGTHDDLPCPWCRTPAAPDADVCPGCGEIFG